MTLLETLADMMREAGLSRVRVRDLSIEVGRGEIVGLIGPNGAGKSTTLHAVMGLVGARRGEIRMAGSSLIPLGGRGALEAELHRPDGRRREDARQGVVQGRLAKGTHHEAQLNRWSGAAPGRLPASPI